MSRETRQWAGDRAAIEADPYGCKPKCDMTRLAWCDMTELYECPVCALAYDEDEIKGAEIHPHG